MKTTNEIKTPYVSAFLQGQRREIGPLADIAKRADISASNISRLKRGERFATKDEVSRLFRVLPTPDAKRGFVVAYVSDCLPDDLRRRVEIQVDVSGRKASDTPRDELDRAVEAIRASVRRDQLIDAVRTIVDRLG